MVIFTSLKITVVRSIACKTNTLPSALRLKEILIRKTFHLSQMDMRLSKLASLVLAFVLTFLSREGTVSMPTSDEQSLEQLMKFLTYPQTPGRFREEIGPGLTVDEFSVKTCNKTAPVQGTASVTPDPIKIPGNATVGFHGSVGVNITSPTKAVLKISKKFGVWVEIPCVDNLGSCTYSDICGMIPFKPGEPCPAPLSTYNLPCTCPFKQGMYNLPKSVIEIPSTGLPEWLTEGDYRINIQLYNPKEEQLACFDFALSLTD